MDFLAAVPVGPLLNGGGWAIAFWAVLYVARMVYKGDLVPRHTHEDTVKALTIERERSELLLRQLEKATDSMEVFETFVKSLPQTPQGPVRVDSQQGIPARGQQLGRKRQPRQQDWGGWDPPGTQSGHEGGE